MKLARSLFPLWTEPAVCVVNTVAGIFTAALTGIFLLAGEHWPWVWIAGVAVGCTQAMLGLGSLGALLGQKRRQRAARRSAGG